MLKGQETSVVRTLPTSSPHSAQGLEDGLEALYTLRHLACLPVIVVVSQHEHVPNLQAEKPEAA